MPAETNGAVELQVRSEGDKWTSSYTLPPGFPDPGEELAEEQLKMKMNTGLSVCSP